MGPALKSIVWAFFDKTLDGKFVECRLCTKNFKYPSNTSNLRKHIIRKHPIQYHQLMNKDNSCIVIETDLDAPSIEYHIETSDDPVDATDNEIICGNNFVSLNTNRRTSVVWNFFSISDEKKQIAKCNICKTSMSYKTTVSNLKKHMIRKHPTVELFHENEEKMIKENEDPPLNDNNSEEATSADSEQENQAEELNWGNISEHLRKPINKRLKSIMTTRSPVSRRRVAQTLSNSHLDKQYSAIAKLKLELLKHQLEMSKKEEIAKDREALLRQKSLELTLEIKHIQLKNLTALNNT